MPTIPYYEAYVTVYDSAKKAGRVGLRVDATDGKAYVAAADDAARASSKVGLLLAAVEDLILAAGTAEYKHGVDSGFLNDTFAYPSVASKNYRSNKLKVDYTTTNNGLPASGSFSIPMRDPEEFTLESNGINVVLADGAAVAELVTQIVDTLLSAYGTAVPSVSEVTVNDE